MEIIEICMDLYEFVWHLYELYECVWIYMNLWMRGYLIFSTVKTIKTYTRMSIRQNPGHLVQMLVMRLLYQAMWGIWWPSQQLLLILGNQPVSWNVRSVVNALTPWFSGSALEPVINFLNAATVCVIATLAAKTGEAQIQGWKVSWRYFHNLGGGNSKIFMFTPILGVSWSNFDEQIFQTGWSHQPNKCLNMYLDPPRSAKVL